MVDHIDRGLRLVHREKRQRAGRTPGRFAFVKRTVPRASVLDCGGPPPLFSASTECLENIEYSTFNFQRPRKFPRDAHLEVGR